MNSKPISAFKKSGDFCQNNWCCPKCIRLREWIESVTSYGRCPQFKSKKYSVFYWNYADQSYVWITDFENEFAYIVTWYKSRGKTDMILFQGRPIREEELDYLLERLWKVRK